MCIHVLYGYQSLIIRALIWISIWISLDFYGYPWISMDIYASTCYGSSIQGYASVVVKTTMLPVY